jgi:hypothetical protein
VVKENFTYTYFRPVLPIYGLYVKRIKPKSLKLVISGQFLITASNIELYKNLLNVDPWPQMDRKRSGWTNTTSTCGVLFLNNHTYVIYHKA